MPAWRRDGHGQPQGRAGRFGPCDPGHAIQLAGGEALGAGDVTLLGPDIVHSVVNPLGKISVALHVYDGQILTVERTMWAAETLQEQPYDINAVAKGMQQPAAQAAR